MLVVVCCLLCTLLSDERLRPDYCGSLAPTSALSADLPPSSLTAPCSLWEPEPRPPSSGPPPHHWGLRARWSDVGGLSWSGEEEVGGVTSLVVAGRCQLHHQHDLQPLWCGQTVMIVTIHSAHQQQVRAARAQPDTEMDCLRTLTADWSDHWCCPPDWNAYFRPFTENISIRLGSKTFQTFPSCQRWDNNWEIPDVLTVVEELQTGANCVLVLGCWSPSPRPTWY